MTPPVARSTYFESLDLIRGLAALVVLVYHVDFMFGLRGELLPGGYLAVDLFFLLSGFVLSFTYGERVTSGAVGFGRFLTLRLARLYPLFLATTVFGFFVMTARYHANEGWIDFARLLPTGALNLAMLPSFIEPYGDRTLFPFNGATWSIFFEMVASLLFFVWFAKANIVSLILATLAAGLAFALALLSFGNADLGWDTSNIVAGFPRVLFSFGLGMLLHRAYRRRPWTCPAIGLGALLVAWLAILQWKPALSPAPWVDLLMIGLFMPLLVAAGIGASLRPVPARVARWLGDMSYGVYLNQGALIIVAAGLCKALLGRGIETLTPLAGFLFVPAVILVSLVTFHVLERPAREAWRAGWRRRSSRRANIGRAAEDISR